MDEDLKQRIPLDSLFNVQSLVWDFTVDQESLAESYYCQIISSRNTLVLYTTNTTKYKDFSKKFLMYMIEFTVFNDCTYFMISIERNGDDYEKIYRSLLTNGFTSCDEDNQDPENFRLVQTKVHKKHQEQPIEEVDIFH